ncbi:S8 family serine peptidase [Haladaptatus pallidirubidus]|uniref:Peptidase S8/S53 domain-containing protein n=1 Tax=Haladaptatus pallidirubidus TaxID=1008152 RepID=A0AAV3UQC5_9EURY|nr:S8 family serine peptidase [Haladaptatus pallidirubidus]
MTAHTHTTRRTVLKMAGAAGLLGAASAGRTAADTSVVDDRIDTSAAEPHEVVVVFDSQESMKRLTDLDLPNSKHEYAVLPMTYTVLSGDQVRTVAGWDGVRRVQKAVELEFFNDDSRAVTGADVVQNEMGYDGSSVDAVIIDSGFSGPHPDFDGRLESNWQWVDNPLGERDADWVNLGSEGDTDDLGHGTHCAGIVAGDGSASDGQYKGMAPGARISVYSTNQAVYLPYAIGAWDHMLARADDPNVDFDPDVVSNSYGVARDVRYNPNDPLNVATWEAFIRGIIPVFAAGNEGPEADTLSRFAKAPHVLCIGATRDDKHVTNFSSRGRTPDENRETNYDRKKALGNLGRFHAAMTNGQYVVDMGMWAGTVGPAADNSTTGTDASTESEFHEWRAPPNADTLEMMLDFSPDGQQVRVSIRRGSKDGTVVAQMGEEPVHQHRTLTTDVDGGTTYWVEVEPMVSVAVDYTLDYESHEKIRGEPEKQRPVGVYRPSIGTPGNHIMSALGPTDPLDAYAADTEMFYGYMSGTSMACPAAAGICALVIDAARQNGHNPYPIEIINTVEATARDIHKAYTPWNVGAGFADAAAAVRRAEIGDFARFGEVSLADPDTPTSLAVSGRRSDDGSAFTGGQTNQVDVTIASVSHTAEVRDTIPIEWTVKTEYGDVKRVEQVDDVQHVYLGTVVPSDGETMRTYFAEAPNDPAKTDEYTFGSAAANAAKTDDDWVAFGGTETNAVIGEDTNT